MFVIAALVSRIYLRQCRFENTLESREISVEVAATVRVRTYCRCVALRLAGSRCMAEMLFEPVTRNFIQAPARTLTPFSTPPAMHLLHCKPPSSASSTLTGNCVRHLAGDEFGHLAEYSS